MTNTERMIQSAKGFTKPFTVEELMVDAWLSNQRELGMRDFEFHHPDTHKMACYLMGRRGLIRRGILEKLPDGKLQLTKTPQKAPERVRSLTEGQKRLLEQALKSKAYTLFLEGQIRAAVFADAIEFWGIKENKAWGQHWALFNEAVLRGTEFLGRDAQSIASIHEKLSKQFAHHLELLKRRESA